MDAKIIAIVKSKGILATQTTSPPDFSWLVKRNFKDPLNRWQLRNCAAQRATAGVVIARRDCST